ncbi:hypothetical protein T552_00534 [Pneumocystis carinii B80]|uniref:Elongin-C n=1 Tax=Pneumocystis carinii (strain B80) TaxID=1408658 RepID=A0A0W4ZR26_PNEC8|nr:hypothetical protein T552_00534 [Pneumocystis carinii B80]KTW30823.1 hypothetical protein T552_00534 [Pneumocystis carinii B80]
MSLKPEYIKLISSDDFIFVVKRAQASISGIIREMLDESNQFSEYKNNEIKFKTINSKLLYIVCQYFYFHEKYKNAESIPEFPIEPDIAMELLMISDFLDGKEN